MSTPFAPNVPEQLPRNGFALILSLILVSLLLLIIVTFTTVFMNESQTSETAIHQQKAQAQAKLALSVALAQLQEAAGPDQRISARAAILDSDPSTSDIDNVNQPYWTGIWITGNEFLDVGPNPQRITSFESATTQPTEAEKANSAIWLVSMDPNTTDTPLSGPSGSNVELASGLGSNSSSVSVPLVDVESPQSQTLGAYAYWVDDEGVKARANLTDPDFGSTSLERGDIQLRNWSPQVNMMSSMIPMLNAQDDFRETDASHIEKLLTLDAIGNLSTVDSASLDMSHRADISFYSRSVLSDVRNGGLKIDLTAALEDDTNFRDFADAYGHGNSMHFRSRYHSFTPDENDSEYPEHSDGIPIIRPDGVIWDTLFHFYNTYKATPPVVTSDTANAHTGVADVNQATLPYDVSTKFFGSTFTDGNDYEREIRMMDFTPNMISYRIQIGLSSFFDNSDSLWKLRLHYFP